MPADSANQPEVAAVEGVAQASFSQSPTGPGAQSPTLGPRNQVPKTEKPRPHICGTCTRSFARLEHLKRHERSHTKEKPFECPECARCFARRDLLLRHQQKLHLTQTPSSRPRAGSRRESTSSVASTTGRVRKNSISGPGPTPVSNGDGGASTMRSRPRANTIAHIDQNTLSGLAAAGNPVMGPIGRGQPQPQPQQQNRFGGIASVANMGIGYASHHDDGSNRHQMSKIDTSLSNRDLGGMMPRSAGILPSASFDNLEEYMFNNNTVNPAALHFSMSPLQPPLHSPSSPFNIPFSGVDCTYYSVEDDDDQELNWFSLLGGPDQPVDQSSPSAFSQTSASGLSEVVNIEGAAAVWHQTGNVNAANHSMAFPDFRTPNYDDTPPSDALSVEPAMNHQFSASFSSPPKHSPESLLRSGADMQQQQHYPPRHLSPAAASVTDATRTALATTLVQNTAFGSHGHQRRASLPAQALNSIYQKQASINLPLTQDLQRYVDSYIKLFHPHLPFLHLPTLRFDPNGFTAGQHGSNGREYLVLSMAAIGALYEFEQQAAGELFEAAKKLVTIFTDERRKAAIIAATKRFSTNVIQPRQHEEAGTTHLWLVQAKLLNCIFGLQCGDRLANDIAQNDITTLVKLARAAGLTRQTSMPTGDSYNDDQDIDMWDGANGAYGGSLGSDGWGGLGIKVDADEGVAWLNWVLAEERKRTLYGVHYISSLLVAAHNQEPKLNNTEIRLDLPCQEEMWTAESASAWSARGGHAATAQHSPSFSLALSGLLSAGNQPYDNQSFLYSGHQQAGGIQPYPASGIVPSTFGCLVLICALHVYIWETRQNHQGRTPSPDEVHVMQAHIEPALKAWQSAWYLTPHHSIERPNPFGCGPLSADSIPLLDLAYIRLLVDPGRSKDFFWARDFDGMAEELAKGWHPSGAGQSTPPSSASSVSGRSESTFSNIISPASSPASISPGPSPALRPMMEFESTPTPQYATLSLNYQPQPFPQISSSPRERLLRAAAFYAADSLAMSDTLSTSKDTTFSNCGILFRELPIQSALCTFDCAQVLAEWIATVQDRVAPLMGVMTLDQCDLEALEALMVLENDDRKLLGKVRDMLRTAETKVAMEQPRTDHPIVFTSGLGATVLRVSAYMLEQAIVWPATRLMSEALRAQADHMDARTKQAL